MDFSPQIESEAGKIQWEKEKTIQFAAKKRCDFRDVFTFTIDGADAKDLDDAISMQQDAQGNYILWVHIADVAEYVCEDSLLDREALHRATSIYTPGKVIPMLPEAISNDVCSLHPGEPKLVLSCFMTIDKSWNVLHTEIVEGIIDSRHRGIYEEIQKRYEWKYPWTKNNQILTEVIDRSYNLYNILTNRRAKEGKILFDSVETVFDFPPHPTGMIVPIGVHTRTRIDAHMLIEEFMVLANEEVAKWCEAGGIPFLSRVHGLPSESALGIIRQIIATGTSPLCHSDNGEIYSTQKNLKADASYRQHDRNRKNTSRPIESIDIRRFLDSLDSESLYRYSRLLLPKMAKALYRDRPDRHFWLALEYYAHFTSPIRRYPDLQLHRIIKEKLRGTLTDARIIHYKKILGKVARICSERERAAEDIERAFDSLYAVRYMAKHIGETLSGRVAGIAEFAYFVELDNGIEVTIYLPRMSRYRTDDITGILSDSRGKEIAQIWQKLQIQITGVMEEERRIVGERI